MNKVKEGCLERTRPGSGPPAWVGLSSVHPTALLFRSPETALLTRSVLTLNNAANGKGGCP